MGQVSLEPKPGLRYIPQAMPGSSDIKTCPKCGALITPQLARCRHCGTYLHGTKVEGFMMGLLPASFRESPATGLLMLLILLAHALFVLLAGSASIAVFSSYSLVQFGAISGVTLMMGEWWRLLTYMFLHHDLVHLAFNLWALAYAGRAVESLFDAKKMFLVHLAAGVAGGLLSYLYYVHMRGGGHVLFVSGGASGAVCGLIGAALVGARRMGPDGRHLFGEMLRWSLFMVIWGFAVPGINNAAHLGGFAAGAALASFIPVGLTQTVARQRALSVVAILALVSVVAAFGWGFHRVRGQPLSLKQDQHPRRLLFFTVSPGVDRDSSSQQAMLEACTKPIEERAKKLVKSDPSWQARALMDSEYRKAGAWRWQVLELMNSRLFRQALAGKAVTDEMLGRCEASFTANSHRPVAHMALVAMLYQRGDASRAQRLEALASHLFVTRRVRFPVAEDPEKQKGQDKPRHKGQAVP